jgi:hypothetical protein
MQGGKHDKINDTPSNLLGAPALDTAERIDHSDTVTAIESARYRFNASMSDLERHYDAEASKLRAALVEEIGRLYRGDAPE